MTANDARRRDQAAADLQAANAWLQSELAAQTEAKWRARMYGSLTFATWTLCAAVWVAIGVIAVDVLR
jgi:hypothetical protein